MSHSRAWIRVSCLAVALLGAIAPVAGEPRTGRVEVSGRLVTGDTVQPLGGYTFTLQQQTIVTDKEGCFSARLVPGDALLYSGHVARTAEGKQSYIALRRRLFEIPADQAVFKLGDVQVRRYFALKGQLIDRFGKPAPGWNVQASSSLAATDYSMGETDSKGMFEGGYPEDCPPDTFAINRPVPSSGETTTQWGRVEVVSGSPLVFRIVSEGSP